MKLTSKTIAAMSRMWANGMNAKQLADAAGVTDNTIWNYIRNHRDQFPHRNHHADWWRERLETVRGLSGVEAAKRLRCSEYSVSCWRKRLGIG